MNRIHLFHIIISVFIFLLCVPLSHCDDLHDQLSTCRGDYAYRCGSDSLNLSYPFWGENRSMYCGRNGFEIKCDVFKHYHFLEAVADKFKVLNINYTDRTMTLALADTWNDHCGEIIHRNTFFDKVHFRYTPNDQNVSFFYDCDDDIPTQSLNYFDCSVDGEVISGFYNTVMRDLRLDNTSSSCKKGIKVPVLYSARDDLGLGHLEEALIKGFEVEYYAENMQCAECSVTGGICASNRSNAEQFVCLYPQPDT